MAGEDFVMVQLTPAAQKLAKGKTLKITAGRRHFVFESGNPLRVEKSYEWNAVLRHYRHHNGEHLVELVPVEVVAEENE